MNPEKQRIVIAETCGWEFAGTVALIGPGDPRSWRGPNSERMVGVLDLPDYLGDLNAAHDMEGNLSDVSPGKDKDGNALPSDLARYRANLCLITMGKGGPIRATAAQRAEAFLRTMGLWEGDIAP